MLSEIMILSGETAALTEGMIHCYERGLLFGDGVTVTVPVYNGRSFAVLPHLEDLFAAAIALKIPGIYTVEELITFHEELIRETELKDGEIITVLTRGPAEEGLTFPETMVPALYMFARTCERSAVGQAAMKGANLVTEEDYRWLRCNLSTLNKLPEVLAAQKAKVSRAFAALFVRENGKITESTAGNFFVLKDDVLWTHPADNLIFNSVPRRLVKDRLAADLSLQVVEKSFDLEFVKNAEEAFLAGTGCEIMPVTKIDRSLIAGGTPGAVTTQLAQAYREFILRECPAR